MSESPNGINALVLPLSSWQVASVNQHGSKLEWLFWNQYNYKYLEIVHSLSFLINWKLDLEAMDREEQLA